MKGVNLHTYKILFRLGLLLILFGASLEASAQAIEANISKGEIIKMDDFLLKSLKQQGTRSLSLGYTYQTNASEACGYA